MIYLSEEWKRAQWEEFEQKYLDDSDCGGGGFDNGPCGGCGRCMTAQFSYHIMKEEERARVFLAAGFDVCPPMIHIDWAPGYGGSHDAYNCRMSEEREGWFFPWERRD